MTAESLNRRSSKELAELAKKRGVAGWRSMRKEQLVKALLGAKRTTSTSTRKAAVATAKPSKSVSKLSAATKNGSAKARASKNGVAAKAAAKTVKASKNGHAAKAGPAPARKRDPRIEARIQKARDQQDRLKNLATRSPDDKSPSKDRLVVMVRDPYWLHAYWELTRQGVERAQAALGQEWHAARPTLRLYEVSSSGVTSSAEAMIRDITIHGGVNNWYIDVQDPPRSYRLDIGYLAESGKFFVLSRSNVVTTPKADNADVIDENWTPVAENFEKIYAMSGGYSADGASLELQELFEERLRRPMGSPLANRFGPGAEGLLSKKREFSFELDAELLVYGATEPDAHVTLQGDPVKLRPDGTFTVRFSLPNCRQVIPAVASSADGFEQRTIVLAVERNTKTMEPLVRDGND